ncbi:prolactin releasing hormone 2 [Erpetoichthys calabaricus]|uniref:prolactin releasing hormone 2 n=1 Tax=Erpetoichthys calabaricus TaxID=27687 RepID=UPI002234A95D|nr:prolactin releasing hormone 2 [Erpetoichthys calabaricus]
MNIVGDYRKSISICWVRDKRSMMQTNVYWCPGGDCSLVSRRAKVAAFYTVMLLLSVSLATAQSQVFKHEIDNRSPEIDPFWYVGRGVRPIGRFGKRQIKMYSNLQPVVNNMELILNRLRNQEIRRLDQTLGEERPDWIP